MTLEELERLAQLSGARPVTSHDSARTADAAASHMASYDLPRVKSTQERIFEAVAAGNGHWVSRAEICKRMGIVKANWLNKHLAEMVTRNILRAERTKLANGSKMYWYSINPNGRTN